MKNTLILVDGSSYLYRAFHAMPDLRAVLGDPTSHPTGAIRGFINMLNALRKERLAAQAGLEEAPSACASASLYAACVFDASGPTFREALYPEYKAHRSPMPDDLRQQIAPIHEVATLLGWPVLSVPGVEADDVIATLACAAAAQGWEVLISSGDKDLSQLVNEHITIIDTMSGKRRDIQGVTEEFGVPPSLMVDLQTLVGDPVDNVPGVYKVGPKTAAKWLLTYGSLEGLLAKADAIKGVAGENLRKARPWLPTGRELITMRCDVDLSGHVVGFPSLSALALRDEDRAALRPFYERYGFKRLLGILGEGVEGGERDGDAETSALQANPLTSLMFSQETILTPEQLGAWLLRLNKASLVALDTETTSLDPMRAQLVGISFAVVDVDDVDSAASDAPRDVGASAQTPSLVYCSAYLPLAHRYPDALEQLPFEATLAALKPWLEDASRPKLGQHVKYDQHIFANHGIWVAGYQHDTLLQSYVLEAHRPHGLESLASRHLGGLSGIGFEQLCGKGAKAITIDQVDIARVSPYACEDAVFAYAVHTKLYPQIAADPGLRDVYALEMATSEALLRIERNGVLIDAQLLRVQSQVLGERIMALEAEAHTLAGSPFNLSSPKQLGEILFEQLGLPVIKKTATGVPSTDEEVLEKLALDYPLPAKLLVHRSLSKLKNTYTDKLSQLALPRTGRVHTHYAQATAVTGRLASSDPNLQNIPIRTEEGRAVREAFIARAGWCIASADYSQIELRIMAHLSEDESLLAAFASGADIHRATAAEVFGLPLDAVSSEQRRYAKTINFGLIYGMSSFGLAKNLGIETKAAAAYIDRYFARYPGVKHYMTQTQALAKAQGYVRTVMGRRLYLPEINSPNGPRRAAAQRAAINAPMQGTAADLIKLAMVAVQETLMHEGKETLLIMQVHDELVFEVPEQELAWLKAEVPKIMAGVAKLKVPLLVEVGSGPNWEAAH